MGQSGSIVAADIDRISDSGNHIAVFEDNEYNIGNISISDTENKVLMKIYGDRATKLYAEKEWTSVTIENLTDDQASMEVGDGWVLTVDDEVNYYDVNNIYRVFDEGDTIRVQIDAIDIENRQVFATPLLVSGGLYETPQKASQIDEKGRGLIGTQQDRAQIMIKEFGGFGSEKIVFQIIHVNGPQATGVRYFYPGERLFITPDGDLSSEKCYKELSGERRMVIEGADKDDGRIEVEVAEADFDKVVAQRYPSGPSPADAEAEVDEQSIPTDKLSSEENIRQDGVQTDDINSPGHRHEPEHSDPQDNSQDVAQTDDNNSSNSKQESEHAGSQNDSNSNISSQTDSPKPTYQEQDPNGDNQPLNTEKSSHSPGYDADIEELRNKAVEDAVEEVPEKATTTTQEPPQYNRSKAVREYVMARADGQCEGCGEPAPFTSKTGKPYLHAHHVHELSDSGSDTPDTVIALCPNCHYQIHHGKEGKAYNDYLIKKLEKIETDG